MKLILQGCIASCVFVFSSLYAANCQTQALVTTSQTVSFYLGLPITENYLGTATVGQWLKSKTLCVDNKHIYAETWDSTGKKYTYRTQNTYTNTNGFITVLFPKDFVGAPQKPAEKIFCTMHLINNSQDTINLYARPSFPRQTIAVLSPRQNLTTPVACMVNEYLIAKPVLAKTDHRRYLSLSAYTNINTQPVVIYPNNFQKTSL